jgi:hypothetical protein
LTQWHRAHAEVLQYSGFDGQFFQQAGMGASAKVAKIEKK